MNTKNITDVLNDFSGGVTPFPVEWISEYPDKVEDALAKLSIEDQIRYAMQLQGSQMQDFINLSPCSQAVIRGLPPEELYQMIKETGIGESLPVLAMMSQNQLQYSFDLEWWQRDLFVPECALEWLEFLDACEDSSILQWLQNEDFDQKVVLFQSLIKVYKDDEMTNSYEGVEGMAHLSLDGVYDIFFKTEEYGALKRLLTLLRSADPTLYTSILEGVIWYPVTQTIEKAYRWRLIRTAERGIPDFEEAMGVYSYPSSSALKIPIPELEDFANQGEFSIAPTYPLLLTGSVPFFKDVILRLGNSSRLNTISWELVYLANKIMVADQVKPSDLEIRNESLQKVLGYINIGLELGASGDLEKGAKLLSHTHAMPLFQAGYQQLMSLKWKTESFLKENGSFLEWMFTEFHKDLLAALLERFPRVAEVSEKKSLGWRHFTSIQDVRNAESFLDQWIFYHRFARKGLGLNERIIKQYLGMCDVPVKHEMVDLTIWTTMAFAHYILFKKISCAPLSEPAAKSFLGIVFLPGIFKEEVRQCDNALVESFKQGLLKLPLAWTDTDQKFLASLLNKCVLDLQQEFGRLDLKGEVDWRFTHGLCIAREILSP
jgi:hypothetical protein